jgi:predicted dithiol-disulfide oxidoreductase (DUF899 family)
VAEAGLASLAKLQAYKTAWADVSLGGIARRRCARGVDGLWAAYAWLDRAPKGRNETGFWWRRHDEYDKR